MREISHVTEVEESETYKLTRGLEERLPDVTFDFPASCTVEILTGGASSASEDAKRS